MPPAPPPRSFAAAASPDAQPWSASSHYENFPVASWLCPPRLRPPIAAIYAFARTADDIADEGDASARERLGALAAYRMDLKAISGRAPHSPRWPRVFGPLAEAMRIFRLPEPLLADLLSAFEQDIEKTRDGAHYANRRELLAYCERSANPVGRLLLHLYGVADKPSLARSDAICSALQLINFWQDAGTDLARGRCYFPVADCVAHGLMPADLKRFVAETHARSAQPAIKLIAEEVRWARALMQSGAPLALRLPGRAGWELRLVVQGGLLILDKIEALGFDTLRHRPTIGRADAPRLAWRALRMR